MIVIERLGKAKVHLTVFAVKLFWSVRISANVLVCSMFSSGSEQNFTEHIRI